MVSSIEEGMWGANIIIYTYMQLEDEPKEKCLGCGKEVDLSFLKTHIEVCKKGKGRVVLLSSLILNHPPIVCLAVVFTLQVSLQGVNPLLWLHLLVTISSCVRDK